MSLEIFDYSNLSNSDSQLLNTNAEIVCKNYLCIEMERFFCTVLNFLTNPNSVRRLSK